MHATTATTAPLRGLLTYRRELEEEIFAFQREAYPYRRADWIAPRWRWMFVRAAERLGIDPMVWVYRKDSAVVAHQGAIPVKLQVAGTEWVTGWFVETMVIEKFRGGPMGPSVVAKAKQDLPLNLSLGQSAQMRAMQFSLGWRQVCPLETLMYVVDAPAVAAVKIPQPLKRKAAIAALTARRWLRRMTHGRQRVEVLPVETFGAEHDALWRSVKDAYRAAVVRDASYLNWKYVEQPGQQFDRLEIRRRGRLESVAIVARMPKDEHYNYTRAILVDVVVRPDDPAAVLALFESVERFCRGRGVAAIVFDVINPLLTAAATRFGFINRGAERFLLVCEGALPEPARAALLDPSAWLITRGDSDIDRPW